MGSPQVPSCLAGLHPHRESQRKGDCDRNHQRLTPCPGCWWPNCVVVLQPVSFPANRGYWLDSHSYGNWEWPNSGKASYFPGEHINLEESKVRNFWEFSRTLCKHSPVPRNEGTRSENVSLGVSVVVWTSNCKDLDAIAYYTSNLYGTAYCS